MNTFSPYVLILLTSGTASSGLTAVFKVQGVCVVCVCVCVCVCVFVRAHTIHETSQVLPVLPVVCVCSLYVEVVSVCVWRSKTM